MNRRDAVKAFLGVPLTATVATVAAEDLKPDDVIVLEVPGEITPDMANKIRAQAEILWPGHKVAVLAAGMKLRIVKGDV